jgi:hypothetical protein
MDNPYAPPQSDPLDPHHALANSKEFPSQVLRELRSTKRLVFSGCIALGLAACGLLLLTVRAYIFDLWVPVLSVSPLALLPLSIYGTVASVRFHRSVAKAISSRKMPDLRKCLTQLTGLWCFLGVGSLCYLGILFTVHLFFAA